MNDISSEKSGNAFVYRFVDFSQFFSDLISKKDNLSFFSCKFQGNVLTTEWKTLIYKRK